MRTLGVCMIATAVVTSPRFRAHPPKAKNRKLKMKLAGAILDFEGGTALKKLLRPKQRRSGSLSRAMSQGTAQCLRGAAGVIGPVASRRRRWR